MTAPRHAGSSMSLLPASRGESSRTFHQQSPEHLARKRFQAAKPARLCFHQHYSATSRARPRSAREALISAHPGDALTGQLAAGRACSKEGAKHSPPSPKEGQLEALVTPQIQHYWKHQTQQGIKQLRRRHHSGLRRPET